MKHKCFSPEATVGITIQGTKAKIKTIINLDPSEQRYNATWSVWIK